MASSDAPGEITELLTEVRLGKSDARSRLAELVYSELRRLATACMYRERPDHTLQPTALIHEAWLRLIGSNTTPIENRVQFFAAASTLMRQILVDYARARRSEKRGGARKRVELNDGLSFTTGQSEEILSLDSALAELAALDPRQSRIVELRFFGGLTEEEVAAMLGISARTVKREWSVAKAWLYAHMQR